MIELGDRYSENGDLYEFKFEMGPRFGPKKQPKSRRRGDTL